MKLKKIVTLVSSAILAFSLVGCSIEGEESSAGSDGAVVGNGSIGFSVSTLNNPFFVTLSQGAKDKAKEEGRDLISLITCTPYGVNTHRLVVTGERTTYEKSVYESIKKNSMSIREIIFTIIPFGFVSIVIVMKLKEVRKRKNGYKEN